MRAEALAALHDFVEQSTWLSRGRAGSEIDLIVDKVDLDPSTKQWLSQEFTKTRGRTDRVSMSTASSPISNGPSSDSAATAVVHVAAPSGVAPSVSSAAASTASPPALSSSKSATPVSTHVIAAAAATAAAAASASAALVPAPTANLFSTDGVSMQVLDRWDFDVFAYTPDQLMSVCVRVLERHRCVERLAPSEACMGNFVRAMRDAYLDNPYHNWYHAVDVMQTAHAFLALHEGEILFSTLEKTALLLGALAHDVRHPGLTNLYQINARTPLAQLYNDQSVLEHHHAATFFRLLSNAHNNITAALSREDSAALRKMIIGSILSTDMQCHFTLIQRFDAAAQAVEVCRLEAAVDPLVPLNARVAASHREVLLNTLLHAADISNPCKPWLIARKWSDNLLVEFFGQGDMEASMGMPMSPNTDRATTEQAAVNLNFVRISALRCFPAYSLSFHGIRCASWCDRLISLSPHCLCRCAIYCRPSSSAAPAWLLIENNGMYCSTLASRPRPRRK